MVLSSDELRVELYGDVNHQDSNSDIFQELYKRAKQLLKAGNNVIIDATNINRKRRIAFINDFSNYYKEVHYISKSFDDCVEDDLLREKKVGKSVIERMHKSLTIPTYVEKWDNIKIVKEGLVTIAKPAKNLLDVITQEHSYEELFAHLGIHPEFRDIKELPHDSKWHSLSVSRHTYEVWKYILDNYQGKSKTELLFAALLHDTGKYFCKEFKEGSRYASFISHEYVSGQLTCDFLFRQGFKTEFILKVVELVQLHMRLLSIENNTKAKDKLLNLVGEEMLQLLSILREADVQAH